MKGDEKKGGGKYEIFCWGKAVLLSSLEKGFVVLDMDGGSGFVCNQCDYVGNCFNSLKFHQKVEIKIKCI